MVKAFDLAGRSVAGIPKNRCRTTIAERMVETRAELPFIGDQIVCLSHDHAARRISWPAMRTLRVGSSASWAQHDRHDRKRNAVSDACRCHGAAQSRDSRSRGGRCRLKARRLPKRAVADRCGSRVRLGCVAHRAAEAAAFDRHLDPLAVLPFRLKAECVLPYIEPALSPRPLCGSAS